MNFAARNILIFPLVILTPFLAWYFLSSETPAPVLPSKVDVVEQKTPVVPTPSAVDQGLEEPAFETPRAFARITGTVRRSDTKAPISNYKIVLLDEVPRSSAQWTAILGIDGSDAGSFGKPKYKWRSIESANGRFQLDDIPSDQPVALGVKAKGFDSVYRAIPAIEGASTLDGIDFLLDPPTGMEGYITTSDGKPIKGVGIYVGQNTYGRVLDRTDDKGYFRVIGLAGESIDIFIYHGDFLPLTSRVFLTRHAIVSLTLALNSGGTVTGMVRKDDESVPGVELVLSDSDQTIKVRRTDREGRFKLAGLPAGAFELTAKAPGSGNGASQTVKRLVEVVDGHETQVDFEVPSEKSSLSG